MLIRPFRRRRARERGQTLILALAFIAFFGVVTAAVLGVAGVTGQAHINSESVARENSLAEGGGAYGAADAGRPDIALTCTAGDTGVLTMQGGDKAQYAVKGCGSSGGVGSGPGPGPNCLLCILNVGGSASTSVLKATCPQCTTAALVTTGGDDYLNGSITSNTSLVAQQSVGPPVAFAGIKLLEGASDNGCACTPTPTRFAPAITDPLACGGLTPACAPASAAEPKMCTTSASCTPNTLCHNVPGATWSATAGCSITFTSTQATLGPGLWNGVNIFGNPSTAVTMDDAAGGPGIYVFTGSLSVGGNATVSGSDVMIYLACTNFTNVGQACSGNGATISFAGNGSTTISAPTTGPYQNLAILSDPNLPDPGGAGSCQGGGGCMYMTSGNGAAITGSIDTRSGGIAIGGNAGQTVSSGRLITNSLFMNVSGHAGSGLSLTGGPGFGPGSGTCGVYDLNPVTGTSTAGGAYSGVASSTGRAVVQSQCSTTHDTGAGGTVTYTPNTLIDTSKSWTANMWAGATVLAGSGAIAKVASNTPQTLTLTANWSATPVAGSSYSLSFGTGVIYFNYVP